MTETYLDEVSCEGRGSDEVLRGKVLDGFALVTQEGAHGDGRGKVEAE